MGFPGGLEGNEYACKAGELDLIPKSRRSPGERNGYPLQFFCQNSMDRGACQAAVYGVVKRHN